MRAGEAPRRPAREHLGRDDGRISAASTDGRMVEDRRAGTHGACGRAGAGGRCGLPRRARQGAARDAGPAAAPDRRHGAAAGTARTADGKAVGAAPAAAGQ